MMGDGLSRSTWIASITIILLKCDSLLLNYSLLIIISMKHVALSLCGWPTFEPASVTITLKAL